MSQHCPKCTPRPPAVIMISDLEWIFLLQTDLGFFSAAATMSWMMISISSLSKSSERVLWFYVPLGPSNLDEDHSISWSNKPSPISTPCCNCFVVWVWPGILNERNWIYCVIKLTLFDWSLNQSITWESVRQIRLPRRKARRVKENVYLICILNLSTDPD